MAKAACKALQIDADGHTHLAALVDMTEYVAANAFTQNMGTPWLGAVTPIGGLAFLAGWLCLAAACWRS